MRAAPSMGVPAHYDPHLAADLTAEVFLRDRRRAHLRAPDFDGIPARVDGAAADRGTDPDPATLSPRG